MDNQILATLFRGIVIYIAALILARLMGRKLISQMTFFDFVVGVSLGSLVANFAIGSGSNSINTGTALLLLSFLVIATDFLHIKSFIARKLIDSEPVTVIDTGNIVQGNMKKLRLTVEELTMKLREKNIFSLADVEFAIMETDGELSVLPKPDKAPLTPSHMNLKTSSTGLMKDIIIDGRVMEENLASAGLNVQWLQQQLGNKGISDAASIFYAGVDNSKQIYVSLKNSSNTEGHGKYGIE